MEEKIWLSPPHLTGEEQQYIKEAFDTNWIAPKGTNIEAFEEAIKKYTKTQHCTVLTSGTAAIHLALIILGIKEADEVICPTFTFAATINPVCYIKATPIFVDSERETQNMSPKKLEEAIKERIAKGKKPKAILLVHIYGMPAKIDEIQKIATKYQIPIIEDAADTLGATYKNQKVGTFGEIGIYSFNGNKIITTSGGGAIISNKKEHTEKAKYLATQAREEAPHYQHTEIGYNYRMSNVLAGIGRGQMEVIDDRIKARRENFKKYKKELKEIKEITFTEEPENTKSNRWLTTIQTDTYQRREKIRKQLQKENIETRPLWKPMHLQPVFKKYPAYINGTAEDLYNKGLCLPSGSKLKTADIQRIVKSIKKAF